MEVENRNSSTLIELPDYKIDQTEIPKIRIKSIRLENFQVFEDHIFDFSTANGCKQFICFFGPNGCGKTTILQAIENIMASYEGYKPERLRALLGSSVRHIDGSTTAMYGENGNFLIAAQFETSIGNYEIRLNKNGFIRESLDGPTNHLQQKQDKDGKYYILYDHPQLIKGIIRRLVFAARFDQELHQFQLPRDKWVIFKDLFESVTGFEIREKLDIFSASDDPVQAKLLKEYILGFEVIKPHEIISHKECSAGERKIIKSFSTLLSKDYNPQIILIDNIAMHVESGRHLNLIDSIKRCFPNSQIFSTTHSYQISRHFGDKTQLYDLRLIRASDIIKKEPWRLYFSDELRDCLSKLNSMTTIDRNILDEEIRKCNELIGKCFSEDSGFELLADVRCCMGRISYLFTLDTYNFYQNKS
jgi:energy-coupling factor transporter ATP-binding protein EcfA2